MKEITKNLQKYFSTRNSSFIDNMSDKDKVVFIKELSNVYFRDQLYGEFRSDSNIILSSGSVDHDIFNIPEALKFFIKYALDRNWYGYSDSRGRLQTRAALALYANTFFDNNPYSSENICITMGATASISALFEYISKNKVKKNGQKLSALCAVPNYPPLVKSMTQYFDVELVELSEYVEDSVSLQPMIEKITSETPIIFLQTVINPSGKKISENSLAELIGKTSENTLIILDECHECFGEKVFGQLRTRKNVIRVNSLSKEFFVPGMKLGWFIADKNFIDDYYEYASSSYGSPASLFYLLIESLAIFEMHRQKGVNLDKKFFSEYNISGEKLGELYHDYVKKINKNNENVIDNRLFAIAKLKNAGFEVIEPTHSLNILINIPGTIDSYSVFLELLHNTGVSVYPGVLSFIFSKPYVRISPNINRDVLNNGLDKIINFYKL
jgi:aspartate/methionine/tyrosine aminotransferase